MVSASTNLGGVFDSNGSVTPPPSAPTELTLGEPAHIRRVWLHHHCPGPVDQRRHTLANQFLTFFKLGSRGWPLPTPTASPPYRWHCWVCPATRSAAGGFCRYGQIYQSSSAANPFYHHPAGDQLTLEPASSTIFAWQRPIFGWQF
ncbi:MAG: hypothetical protein H6667_15695 [Ardenticatenaceae bacterium]|nr:hypothetical protein [Ardenticatenaceae bacterium]